jgi:hypothetical protein
MSGSMTARHSAAPLTEGFGGTATMVQMINDVFTMTDLPAAIADTESTGALKYECRVARPCGEPVAQPRVCSDRR